MLLWIWTRDDESGLLDDEFRDGDIFQTQPDSFEPSIGNQEKKSFLILKIPDPPNYNKFETDMVDPEYTPGATPGSENVIRRKRKYKIDWRQRFSANEINLIESASDTLPDGATQGGGTVVSGVVSDLFTVSDMLRK